MAATPARPESAAFLPAEDLADCDAAAAPDEAAEAALAPADDAREAADETLAEADEAIEAIVVLRSSERHQHRPDKQAASETCPIETQ